MLPKNFLSRSAPLTRPKAWGCAAINQLAFPGLGTIIAGRKTGYVQAALMLAGFFLTMGFMFFYLKGLLHLMMDSELNEAQAKDFYKPYAWAGITGLELCAIAWGWSLLSSIAILRATSPPPSQAP